MMHSIRAAAIAASLVGALALTAGCESIAGIEDREFVEGSQSSALCEDYCTTVLSNCTGTHMVYENEADCLSACAALPEGTADDGNANSVQCRLRQARNAATTSEPQAHCPFAGHNGGNQCGTNCEGYCSMLEATCPEQLDTLAQDCVSLCNGVPDNTTLNREADIRGDTVQCRMLQLEAAFTDAEANCAEARPAALPEGPCNDPPDTVPACEEYCNVVMAACTGEYQVWESKDQCMAVCPTLEKGLASHTVEDTVGCRIYHSYSSFTAPEVHCAHSALGGDGHCGLTNCPAYCLVLQDACPTEFEANFGIELTDCEAACSTISGSGADTGYSIAADDDNTMQCRIKYLARAVTDSSNCASAVGGGACQ